MNPRTVHQLMLRHFSQNVPVEWVYFCDCSGVDETKKIEEYLKSNFSNQSLLVEVHRTAGGFFEITEAAKFIAMHICKYHIRIANRSFTTFAIFSANGVTTAWHVPAQESVRS